MQAVTAGPAATGLSPAPISRRLAPASGRDAPTSGAGITRLSSDTVASLLREISAADAGRLIDMLGRSSSMLSAALPSAVSAAAKASIPVDASQVESLQSESAVPLAPADIEHLVYRLTSVAKMDAEVRLGQAAQLTQTFGPKTLADWEMGTETMLLMANRLFDAGGHGNYVRSAELAQVLIDDYQRVPVIVDSRSLNLAEARSKAAGAVIPDLATRSGVRRLWKELRERMEPRVNALWVRAPLLILLLAWFALGLAGDTVCLLLGNLYSRELLTAITAAASEIWGLGFLALVGLGFYLRIRNVRFGRER